MLNIRFSASGCAAVLAFCCYQPAAAQLRTVLTEDCTVSPRYDASYTLHKQDSVTIHAYKKTGTTHLFLLETPRHADLVRFDHIPFAVEPKALKRLPKAESREMQAFLSQRKQEIEARQKAEKKRQALAGNCRAIVCADGLWRGLPGSLGTLEKGDTLHLLGCSGQYAKSYALYSRQAAGVFIYCGTADPFRGTIDADLPPADDADVEKVLETQKARLRRQAAQEKARYRSEALAGNVKAVIATSSLYDEKNHWRAPFSYGDTVAVVGYDSKGFNHLYALYSPKGQGVFSGSEPVYVFKNHAQLRFGYLPKPDDPDVADALQRQQRVQDSLQAVQDSLKRVEYNQSAAELMQLYKGKNPVLVEVDSWSTNSVGGISVKLSVTNCSLKTIKYISFQGYFLNAVGDKCRNEIGGSTVWKARGIGPIGPRPSSLDNFAAQFDACRGTYDFDDPTFYSEVADAFHLSSVSIQYMDGKTITLSGAALQSHVIY